MYIFIFITARRGTKRGSGTSQASGRNYLSSSGGQEYCGQDCQLRSQVNDTGVVSCFWAFSHFSSAVLISMQLQKLKQVTARDFTCRIFRIESIPVRLCKRNHGILLQRCKTHFARKTVVVSKIKSLAKRKACTAITR